MTTFLWILLFISSIINSIMIWRFNIVSEKLIAMDILINNLGTKYRELQELMNEYDDRNLNAYSKDEDLYKFFTAVNTAIEEIEEIYGQEETEE